MESKMLLAAWDGNAFGSVERLCCDGNDGYATCRLSDSTMSPNSTTAALCPVCRKVQVLDYLDANFPILHSLNALVPILIRTISCRLPWSAFLAFSKFFFYTKISVFNKKSSLFGSETLNLWLLD